MPSLRKRLPNRRPSKSFNFTHEAISYTCSYSRFRDGSLAEIFLTSTKAGSMAQINADTAAILASLCLQHGVPIDTIKHGVQGPIRVALELADKA